MKQCHRLVITSGEPSGIGPDLVVKIAQNNWPFELVVCADANLLKERATLLNLPLTLISYNPSNQCTPQKAGTLTIFQIPLRKPSIPGKLCAENSFYVLETLKQSCDGCLRNEFAALVTGPVNKEIINKVGINFTGHTEFFKEYSHSKDVVMMLVTEKMRVALVTTHLPIRLISSSINSNLLRNVITILHYDLRMKFGIMQPRILVCGINPHAGEGGYIGTEEVNIIIPVLKEMKSKGINLDGPLPADTIFQQKYLSRTDVILAMYHDQGLPVIKYQGFGRAVNTTLGLPFIRTSVDHGTALELAGSKKTNARSFISAINLAIKMVMDTK